ncbi:MAG: phosphopantothenoylcysteine decarboxylase [Planctomycetota bacterium]
MHVLVTAGPTREYLDDVRFLSNASSGRMGYAVAAALRDAGHAVTLVSGPVELPRPDGVTRVDVETTGQMRDACLEALPGCDGVIAVAAVCDYKPAAKIEGKITKTGGPVTFEMIETDDVLAEIGRRKSPAVWTVGFALEAANPRERALQKLRAKNCDWVVVNGPDAIAAETNAVELIGPDGGVAASWEGTKAEVARHLVAWVERHHGDASD